jgi:fibronectin type 3 domain-containing protein
VRVASSASLNFTSAMTLSAWIRPTAANSGWRTLIQRQADAYMLNASTDVGPLRPGGGGTFGGAYNNVVGPTASPLDTWTFLALTYDGTILRLYVNGTQVATRASSGAIQTVANPLWIGGNQPYGEFFTGLIDEARVYNRALTATEVTNDMNTSIVPSAPDTTPPSAPGNLSATAVSSGQVNLSWNASTDNTGVASYRVERCTGTGCTDFAEVGTPTGTTFNDTGRAASTTYRYRVRAADMAGNLSDYSTIVSATTDAAGDLTAPSAPTALAATTVSSSRIDLSWGASTDNVGVTQYLVERCQGATCTNWAQVGTSTSTTFSNTGLAGGTTYRFRVRASDAAGNLSAYSSIASATTSAGGDTTAPSAPTGVTATPVSTSQINVAWTASTDNVGVTEYRIERCQGSNCTSWAQVGTSTTTSFSSTGLAANTVYRFRVRAADAAGNLSAYSAIVSARTVANDTTRPSTPSGLAATATGPNQINLTWTASTDNVGVTGYRVERCLGASCTNWGQIASPTTNSYSDTTVVASTLYRYRVRATDAAGNFSLYSAIAQATTPAVADSQPPSDPSGLTATAVGSGQADLAWTASTDNVRVASYRVERCQGAGCTTFTEVAQPTTNSYSDTGLAASTTYRYRVRAVDPSNNFSGYSSTADATTGAQTGAPPGMVGWWGFNEGAGTTAADASGNGNTGTITAATWSAQGRYGGALSFNGTDALVRVPSAASLNFTSAMTLSVWIRPAVSQSGWRTAVQRQADAYMINASTDTGPLRSGGGGTFNGNWSNVVAPTATAVGAWTHLAYTYDGTTQRLYVNGTQVATKATTGAIQSVTNPLWIGGNQPYGEYFNGLIDEVHAYNRALTAGEITSDMNTAAGGPALPSFAL